MGKIVKKKNNLNNQKPSNESILNIEMFEFFYGSQYGYFTSIDQVTIPRILKGIKKGKIMNFIMVIKMMLQIENIQNIQYIHLI